MWDVFWHLGPRSGAVAGLSCVLGQGRPGEATCTRGQGQWPEATRAQGKGQQLGGASTPEAKGRGVRENQKGAVAGIAQEGLELYPIEGQEGWW